MLPEGKPSAASIQIGENWYAPLGGLLICAAAAFALLGFPLDDVWHRLFGQDVTLWGPTHLMLIGGASLTLVGMAVLLVEGQRYNRTVAAQRIAAGVAGRRGAEHRGRAGSTSSAAPRSAAPSCSASRPSRPSSTSACRSSASSSARC